MKTNVATQPTLQTVRTNQHERERFLNMLLKRNGARIFRTLAVSVKPCTQMFRDLLNGDLQQAFLLGAHKALERFNETDDGRGKNDYAGFCAWAGMNAVLDRIRQAARESKHYKPELPIGDFKEHRANTGDKGEPLYSYNAKAVNIVDPIRDLLAYDMIAAFLPKLDPKDRIIAELMLQGYGPAQRNNDPAEENRGRRQNYLRELEMATGYSEQKLMASIRRLRKAAEEHFGYKPRG